MINACIASVASNCGKTLLSAALLYYYRGRVRPYKIGPDFIDPQFHKVVCEADSVNLDSFIMNEEQTEWLYARYSDKEVSILEGVMGFYDGEDKGCSSYSVSKLLGVPCVLTLDCRGSYITISAVLKGLREYKKDNTIKAVVLNYISSASHYELIKGILNREHSDISVLGWIKKGLPALKDAHLGLDLQELEKLKHISEETLEHIDMALFEKIAFRKERPIMNGYPFETFERQNKRLALVYDDNFSFLYYDNLEFFRSLFKTVTVVDSTKDEVIADDADAVFICGGYVETPKSYSKIKNSKNFRQSLIAHSKTKKIYGECAGLLYLGKSVDKKKMSGVLDVSFTLSPAFARLGYYYGANGVKGHAFHYTKPIDDRTGIEVLSKRQNGGGSIGGWENENKNVYGTYLHTMFRANVGLVGDRLLP